MNPWRGRIVPSNLTDAGCKGSEGHLSFFAADLLVTRKASQAELAATRWAVKIVAGLNVTPAEKFAFIDWP